MVGIAFNITLSRDLLNFCDDLETELAFAMNEAAQLQIREMKEKVTEVGAVASGDMRDGIELTSVSYIGATIIVPKPGKLIEEGRPPGKIPPWSVFKPILERWARYKGINTDNLYPIARKIREKGFRARYPIQRALNTSEVATKSIFVSRLRVRFK